MELVKVAVASTDGKHVNEHFGKADRFLIYEMGPIMTLLEERSCARLSVDDPNHKFDPDKFDAILDTIKDCKKIYVSQIGAVPEAALKSKGFEVIRCGCAIDQIAGCGGNCKSG